MNSTSPLALQAGSADFLSRLRSRALYSPKETENILGVSHATLYRMIAAGKLDAVKIGAATRITGDSIERCLAGLPKA
jgi:excisionase family DNA binding protein